MTRPNRKSFRIDGSTVAVTGAAGFIGSAVCRRLAGLGARPIGVDLDLSSAPAVEAAGAEFAPADITDRAALDSALSGGIDAMVHTAALVTDWMTMGQAVNVNVRGTINALDAAREAGGKRVVHISSVVVYGYDDASEQEESAPRRSVGIPYIDTKSSSDRVASRRGAITVRPGDVYGPGSVPWTLRALEMVRAPGAMIPSGTGTMLPVYIDDLVDAIVAALERGTPGDAYTAWEGIPVGFREYFDAYARMAGLDGVRTMPRPVAHLAAATLGAGARITGRPPRFSTDAITLISRRGTASIEKARTELGWEPVVPLAEGLTRTERWLRDEGLL